MILDIGYFLCRVWVQISGEAVTITFSTEREDERHYKQLILETSGNRYNTDPRLVMAGLNVYMVN